MSLGLGHPLSQSSPVLLEASFPEEITCVPRAGVTSGLFKPGGGAGLGYQGPEQPPNHSPSWVKTRRCWVDPRPDCPGGQRMTLGWLQGMLERREGKHQVAASTARQLPSKGVLSSLSWATSQLKWPQANHTSL